MGKGKTKAPVDLEMLERVRILMVKLNVGSTTAWAKMLGIPQPTLNKKIKGDENFSYDQLLKILEVHEKVSADWLLLGRGEMFIGNKKATDVPTCEDIEQELLEAKTKIKEQADKILELTEEIKKKSKQIDVLLEEKVELYNK